MSISTFFRKIRYHNYFGFNPQTKEGATLGCLVCNITTQHIETFAYEGPRPGLGRYFCDQHLREYMQLCREHGDAAAEPIRKMDEELAEMYKREGPSSSSTNTWHFFG